MKFAKELEQELVPEWSAKYLDYKKGKKKLKAVSRAVRQANRTPLFRQGITPSPYAETGYFPPSNRPPDPSQSAPTAVQKKKNGYTALEETDPLFEPDPTNGSKLTSRYTRYGSIWASPPREPTVRVDRPPSLILPGPAISSSASNKAGAPEERGESAYEAGATRSPGWDKALTFGRGSLRPNFNSERFRRLFSMGGGEPSPGSADFPMDAYREIEARQSEFFGFLDSELEKIETFYKEKEDEATERLNVLRDQLHILRDRRLDELVKSGPEAQPRPQAKDKKTIFHAVNRAWDSTIHSRIGKQSRFMQAMTTPRDIPRDDRRDYVRRLTDANIPYRSAKRKLKLAMQEYYRSLELLKSYALLNRTAFRKITKKFDKSLNARPVGRYMSEKVSKAWFVKSDVLDGHIQAVEDLYARYFEAGSHKIAASKLRTKAHKSQYHGGVMFRNGLYISAGTVFGVQGIVNGAILLGDADPDVSVQTSYLLQMYAGYLLMVLLAHFFCFACEFWTRSKVNYVFIFELDTRHHLDWRQLFELPCLFTFLLGFFVWINFSQYGSNDMYIYYPAILIGITGLILFCPFPILYSRTRTWFLYTIWRLFFSGFYPVEFRDFFMGDMFCSTSYSLGNIELFFCLYANHWSNPTQCNSTHSRLLGFLTTLPGIWRALQCVRRYYDTRNIFPHLVNCGKYTWTILYYMSLSLYRLNQTTQLRAFFIFAASINAIYCSIWDLVMDWSLLDPTSPKIFLRDTLAYKQIWMYYLAIFIDPILRFSWIFYAIYVPNFQHSAFLSFIIGLLEVFRRAYWVIFRVENEHCTNVGRFRAIRNLPLPYATADYEPAARESEVGLEQPPRSQEPVPIGTPQTLGDRITPVTTGSDRLRPSPSLRMRKRAEASPIVRGLTRVGSILHQAHAQDFERRKKVEDEDPEEEAAESSDEDEADGNDSFDVSTPKVNSSKREEVEGDGPQSSGKGVRKI